MNKLDRLLGSGFFLFILFFLLIPYISANENYTETGFNQYQLGTGLFNDVSIIDNTCNTGDVDCASRGLSDPKQQPLVADLDNDGVNEIIVLDGRTIRLYQNKELDIIDSFIMTAVSTSSTSNLILTDIDNDNFTEMVIYSTVEELIQIVEYNGTAMLNQTSFLCDDNLTTPDESLIKCGEDDSCLLSVVGLSRISTQTKQTMALHFNDTSCSVGTVVRSEVNDVECFPLVKSMDYQDYDNDGKNEYIFSTFNIQVGTAELVKIYYVDINTSNNPVLEQTVTTTLTNFVDPSATPFVCNEAARFSDDELPSNKFITNPIVFNIDGSASNGLETVIGFQSSFTEFRMESYNSDGSFNDDYPETDDTDGNLISNIFRANAFPDTSDVDFCVVGYKDTANEVIILCASELTGEVPESHEYTLTKSDFNIFYNITDTGDTYNMLAHSTKQSTGLIQGTNLDEVLTSYGVIELLRGTLCGLAGTCLANLIFENPKPDGALITIDVEKSGREDILVLTSTNIHYIDDQFSTSGGEIDAFTTNPCIDQTWRTSDANTTRELTVTVDVIDPDALGDLVSARVILFQGSGVENDSGWSINSSSGATFTFTFRIPQTSVPIGNLRLMGRDTSDLADVDIINLAVSSGVTGVIKDECITSVDVDTSIDIIANVTVNVISEEEIEDLRDDILILLNFQPRFAFILGVFLIIISVWFTIIILAENGVKDGMVMLYVPIFVGLTTWIFTVVFKLIPNWTIIVGILFASAWIGIKVYTNRVSVQGL